MSAISASDRFAGSILEAVMGTQNDNLSQKICNSDKVIEMHVSVHCALIAATGEVPTERHRQVYRDALQSLIRLARSEYALSVARDMEQVAAALKD